MAYCDIDKWRFSYVLKHGLDDSELKRFFSESRLLLIQRGGKVQNLPHGSSGRIRALTHLLPRSTDSIVKKWFFENVSVTDPVPVSELIETYRLYEREGRSLTEEEEKRFSRSCVFHLFSNDPSGELIAFLKTPMPGDSHQVPNEIPTTTPQEDNSSSICEVSAPLTKAIICLTEKKDPDPYLSDLPQGLSSVLGAVYAACKGCSAELVDALSGLADKDETSRAIIEYAERVVSREQDDARVVYGVTVDDLLETDGAFEYDLGSDRVVGVCTKDSPETAVFVKPLVILRASGELIRLNTAHAQKIFFRSGDVIAFAGKNFPRQPRQGEIGVWDVQENPTTNPNHKTNFHLASDKAPVYEIRQLPFSSVERDSVREMVKQYISSNQGHPNIRCFLFQLNDGLVVGAPPGKDLTKDDTYDEGIASWRALHGFRLEGTTYVVGPLPPGELYECGSLSSSIKKMLSRIAPGPEKPSKAQLRYLIEAVESGEGGLNIARARRLKSELEHLDQHVGAINAVLDEVLAREDIQRRIETKVEEIVQARTDQKNQLVDEIKRLEQKYAEVQEKIRVKDKEQKAIAPSVYKAIRASFEKAKREGLESLAQSVLITALQETAEPRNSAVNSHEDSSAHATSILIREPDLSTEPYADVLRKFGVSIKDVKAIEAVARMARKTGLIVSIAGFGARFVVEQWANCRTERNATIVEVGALAIDSSPLKKVCAIKGSDLALLDANLSAIDVYGKSVLDSAISRILQDGSADESLVIASLSSSIASLPIPDDFRRLSLNVKLDALRSNVDEAETERILSAALEGEIEPEWLDQLWPRARGRVIAYLSEESSNNDASLILSLLCR